MILNDYINVSDLAAAIAEDYVIERDHKSLPLVLYSYSRKTVREQVWTDVTKKTRGLIVNRDTHEIVARPFEKFFNFGDATQPETLPENFPSPIVPLVMDKLDGSLGTLYSLPYGMGIASKGSFHSIHAEWATAWYNEHHKRAEWPDGYTPVFEMICEDVQTHIVRYKPREQGLYLLALIKKNTGEELNSASLGVWARRNGFPVARQWFNVFADRLAAETLKERQDSVRPDFYEGYVLSWPRFGRTPLRVKLKTIPFLRLQRLMHHTRPKHILAVMAAGQWGQVKEWLDTPEAPQFVEFVQKWYNKLKFEFDNIEANCCGIFDELCRQLGPYATRKDFALQFQTYKYGWPSVLFAMLPGRDGFEDYRPRIWKLLEPLVHEVGPVSEEGQDET